MRFILVLGLLAALRGPADAATTSRDMTWHHPFISRNVASSLAAVSPWDDEQVRPALRYDDTPSYDDPSKFGGATALPVDN